MKQLKRSKSPLVLTVNGKAAAVVQDAEAYQRLLDIAARADVGEGIRQGLAMPEKRGCVQPGSFLKSSKPGMVYVVNVTSRAQRDLASLFEEINADESKAALMWCIGLRTAIPSLEEQPNRCPATPENHKLRHLLYGSRPHLYRVIHRVLAKQKQVQVLHTRHGARKRFRPSDLA